MIQIAIFGTISVKAKRARPRAEFHQICQAPKNLKQIRNKTHVLRKLSILEELRVSPLFLTKQNKLPKTRKKNLRTRAPRYVLSHEMSYAHYDFCGRLTGKIGIPDNEHIILKRGFIFVPKKPSTSHSGRLFSFQLSVLSD